MSDHYANSIKNTLNSVLSAETAIAKSNGVLKSIGDATSDFINSDREGCD
jgi:hypothetical protein